MPSDNKNKTSEELSQNGLLSYLQNIFDTKQATLKESLEEVIEEHKAVGSELEKEEKNILHNVLAFNEKDVEDVMIPSADIVAVDSEISFQRLKEIMQHKAHTRLPVYKKTLDDIVGFIHIKDLVSVLCSSDSFQIDKLLRTTLFVPPSMKISALLLKMQMSHVHIAIVIDEFGGTCGMLTMEDIMEEIVGEIEDEHDDQEDVMIISKGENIFEASARLPIEDLEKKIGKIIETNGNEEEYDTVGGLIFFLLGYIPSNGEVAFYKNKDGTYQLEFQVLESDMRRIKRVLIHVK